MNEYYFFGYCNGNPKLVLNAYAASVGILATSFIAISYLDFSSWTSKLLCMKALSAPTTPTIIAIG